MVLYLQRNFRKIQRKICHRTIVALISCRKVKTIKFLRQIATFVLLFQKTHISRHLEAIRSYGFMAIWPKYGHMAIYPYGYMASKIDNMGVFRSSNTNAKIGRRS